MNISGPDTTALQWRACGSETHQLPGPAQSPHINKKIDCNRIPYGGKQWQAFYQMKRYYPAKYNYHLHWTDTTL